MRCPSRHGCVLKNTQKGARRWRQSCHPSAGPETHARLALASADKTKTKEKKKKKEKELNEEKKKDTEMETEKKISQGCCGLC